MDANTRGICPNKALSVLGPLQSLPPLENRSQFHESCPTVYVVILCVGIGNRRYLIRYRGVLPRIRANRLGLFIRYVSDPDRQCKIIVDLVPAGEIK